MYWLATISQGLLRIFGKPFLKACLHLRGIGEENLKDIPRGTIFAANHQSELDGFVISWALKKFYTFYYVAREKDFYGYNPFLHWVYKMGGFSAVGAYPVVVGIKNFDKSLAAHIKLLKKGKNLVIFPEGTRTKAGELREAKGGVIALVKATGAPIVPVAISGLVQMRMRELCTGKRHVTISFGKPIYPEELFVGFDKRRHSEYKKLATEKIMPRIQELLDEQLHEKKKRSKICLFFKSFYK